MLTEILITLMMELDIVTVLMLISLTLQAQIGKVLIGTEFLDQLAPSFQNRLHQSTAAERTLLAGSMTGTLKYQGKLSTLQFVSTGLGIPVTGKNRSR